MYVLHSLITFQKKKNHHFFEHWTLRDFWCQAVKLGLNAAWSYDSLFTWRTEEWSMFAFSARASLAVSIHFVRVKFEHTRAE